MQSGVPATCRLDLRFVPAEQSFAERVVHDRAASIPAGYAAPDFATKVLQHTRVQLTWDADDEARKKALGRKVNAEQLREDDFKVRCYSPASAAAKLISSPCPLWHTTCCSWPPCLGNARVPLSASAALVLRPCHLSCSAFDSCPTLS